MPGWKQLIDICDPLVTVSSDPNYCGFEAFITLIKNGITDLVLISTLVVVALLCFVGFIFLTSGGNKSKYDSAKGKLWNIVVGYIWVLAAWLIVYTITSAILDPSFNFLLE